MRELGAFGWNRRGWTVVAGVGALCALGGGSPAAAATPVTALVTQTTGAPSSDLSPPGRPAISANGRFIAFDSSRSNLVAGDTNDASDVFVRDVVADTTERVSVSSTGVQGNGFSAGPVDISADGRYVLFESEASNLIPNDTNDFADVFIRDRQLGTTKRVKHVSDFAFGEWVMSGDARFIAYGPPGHDNTVYVDDRLTGHVVARRVGVDQAGVAAISDDGRSVLVDGSDGWRIWRRGRHLLLRFDQARGGGFANSRVHGDALSADGHIVMFHSAANNLVSGDTNGKADVFVRDLVTDRTARISVSNLGRHEANASSTGLGLSLNGRYRLFQSGASNLVAGDTNGVIDIFVRDRRLGTTTRCSVSTAGVQGNGRSTQGALSRNGRHAAFLSRASNLIAGDTNGITDLFTRGVGC